MMVSLRFTADVDTASLAVNRQALRDAVGRWLDLDGRIFDKDGIDIGQAISVFDDPVSGEYIVTAEVTDPDSIATLSMGVLDGITADVVKDGGTVVPGVE